MRRTEIRYGKSYRVTGSYGRGRAVVNGVEVKRRGGYVFPVMFPDTHPHQKAEAIIGWVSKRR